MEKVISIVNDALRGLCAWLSEAIYSWMTSLYEFFMQMGNVFYNGELDAMYKKVSLIIGIFMVFRVTFWLIETLINPDYLNDKEKSPVKIIQKVLIVVVLLGTTPSIFNLAYRIQDKVISSDLISNILGGKGSTPIETGRYMAAELFSNFYTLNELEDGGVDNFCNNMKSYYYESLSSNGKLTNLSSHSCLSKKAALKTSDEVKPPKDSDDDNEGYVVNFDGLLAVGVGVVILWLLLMYCISIGTRYVQLIFLQVIAPIPIMCYLTPKKDSMFSKWLKQCTTTYLDLFIRVAIINFVMVLINLILGENGILSNIMSSTGSMWIEIFMILGLLTFAKKAPDLIQELLPKSVTKASGDFGLSWKKRTESMLGGKMIYGATKRAPGFVAGGVAGGIVGGYLGARGGKGVGSRLRNGFEGLSKGFATGSKKGTVMKNLGEVKRNQAAYNNKLQQWRINAGKTEDEPNTIGDWFSRRVDKHNQNLGLETKGQYTERAEAGAKSASQAYKEGRDNGISKAIEKRTLAQAFGLGDLTLTVLDQRKKIAEQALVEINKDKLISTADGNQRLATFLGGTSGQSWLNSNGLLPTTTFEQLTVDQKEQLANSYISKLQKESNMANDMYEDNKKKYSFVYQIEQAFGIKRDNNGRIETDASGNMIKGNASEEYINYFDTINSFVSKYDEEFGITTGDNPLFENGTKEFNIDNIANLMRRAEDGEQNAQTELEKVFADWDKIKALMSRVETVKGDEKHKRDSANNKFNNSK